MPFLVIVKVSASCTMVSPLPLPTAVPLAPADDPQGKAKDVFPGSPDVHAWAE